MKISKNKIVSLDRAIETYIKDGAHISIGGFTVNRAPMAAVHEIIRQRIKNLHVYVHSAGQGIDDLIGSGSVSKIELAYSGNGRFAPTGVRFKKAVQQQKLLVEDYSNYQMTLRFSAGAMGIPFLPLKTTFGTNIIDKWGFSASERKTDPRIPNEKLKIIENPFQDWGDLKKVVVVPAINPDVTLIHAQKADAEGTVSIEGLTFADVEQAKAAKNLIVTCEEIMEPDQLRQSPDLNSIPHFCVDAVVQVPFGAYPTACYNYYDYDPEFLFKHEALAKDDETYADYLEEYLFELKDHKAFLGKIGPGRLKLIKADPRTGYATGLDRR